MFKIIVDTETAGLPTYWSAHEDAINIWPRIVEIAWFLLDENDIKISSKEFIIKPEGFLIPKESTAIHGITNEKALMQGTSIKLVMEVLEEDLRNSNLIIAHNIDFDYPVINCEFKRLNIGTKLNYLERFCTMKSSTSFCNIEGPYGQKWPSLQELYFKLFGRMFEDAHRANSDLNACYQCFLELKKIGIFSENILSKNQNYDANSQDLHNRNYREEYQSNINRDSRGQNEEKKWSVGDKLHHIKFGIGTIESVLGTGNKISLIVKFSKLGGKSKILDPWLSPIKPFKK